MKQIGCLIIQTDQDRLTLTFTQQTDHATIGQALNLPNSPKIAVVDIYDAPMVYSPTHEINIDNTL